MRRLGKRQLEAIAWLYFSQGGTWDHSDVVTSLEEERDGASEHHYSARLTDDDIQWIAERVGDLRVELEEKAGRMFNRYVRNKKTA